MENLGRKDGFVLVWALLICVLLLSPARSVSVLDAQAEADIKADGEQSRSKRDLSSEPDSSFDKRIRDFVGKRHQPTDSAAEEESVQKRLRDFVGKRTSDQPGEEDSEPQKRLRDFVGKRESSFENDGTDTEDTFSSEAEKRMRDFVGKRVPSFAAFADDSPENQPVKRMRDFVGKRSIDNSLQDFPGQRGYGYEKRLRDFVGKRNDDTEFLYSKRLRDFVGKRDGYTKRLRYFVGKRDNYSPFDKRLRDFVGKRSNDFGEPNYVKRLRYFVGKRAPEQMVHKRLRDFVGKREFLSPVDESMVDGTRLDSASDGYSYDFEKRLLRDFMNKLTEEDVHSLMQLMRDFQDNPSGDSVDGLLMNPSKRLRDFVGKRSDNGEMLSSNVQKRLRDFVGKRSSDVSKRIREFVGKRGLPSFGAAFVPGLIEVPAGKDITDDDNIIRIEDGSSDSLNPVNKRLRDFVGKRVAVGKRLRDFVGKRDSVGKRSSDFVGKGVIPLADQTAGASPEASSPSKRLRDFVGK